MNELLWLFFGVMLTAVLDRLFWFWRRSEEARRRRDAAQTLKHHGLTPQLYLATIGIEDAELRSALDTFAFTGHIITNTKGEVVGRLCLRGEKGPHLRLVVSND